MNTETRAPSPLLNPVDRFPRAPFPMQRQPWPGLASKMTPRPDQGEQSYRGSGRMLGRKALVTGGDSGIGAATAIAFAKEGADVAINYLPEEEADAQAVVAAIRAAGRKATTIPGDLRDEAFCKKLVDEAVAALGGLDTVTNIAGRQQAIDSIEALSSDDFDATFKTNVYAMFWIVKAALPHLKPGSVIINTTSEQGYNPDPYLLDYASTKAAIANFTKALAKQLAPRGIRVNAVAPEPIWTPLQISGGAPDAKIPQFGAQTPLGRAGQPVELAPVYVTLAQSDLSYGTGLIWGDTGGNPGPG
ncbi:MAG TPA: SDR family oxidoreductase [Candidatus Aquilonibacter sp.]|nr:SDR family oxidoreductase [Candidatus Aquilonibacter sp.]